jgi:hypothetical protein
MNLGRKIVIMRIHGSFPIFSPSRLETTIGDVKEIEGIS